MTLVLYIDLQNVYFLRWELGNPYMYRLHCYSLASEISRLSSLLGTFRCSFYSVLYYNLDSCFYSLVNFIRFLTKILPLFFDHVMVNNFVNRFLLVIS